jgi:hypothetical protein
MKPWIVEFIEAEGKINPYIRSIYIDKFKAGKISREEMIRILYLQTSQEDIREKLRNEMKFLKK